jgi:hypothetical protein
MGTISLNFLQLTKFRNFAISYMERIGGTTAATIAIGKKVLPQVEKEIEKIREEARLAVEIKEIEFAEKDPKTQVVLKNADGTYKFTEQNAKEFAEARSAINNPTTIVEIETWISPNFDTKSLTIFEMFAFDGIVIPPLEELAEPPKPIE